MKNYKLSSLLSVLVLSFVFGFALPNITNAAGPAIVDLGSIITNNFVVLSKAAITNVPPSIITGNIGASPITGAAIAVTCAEMTGTIYTVDAAYTGSGDVTCVAPGPGANKTLVDNAVLDMGTAYTDVAGRTPGVGATNLNVGGGTLSGQDFAPGTYTWDTPGNVSITGNITLTGSATDVWIFQISGSLNLASGVHVSLAGGALPANVFWQVAGETVLGTNSIFNGNILAGGVSTIALQTGATLNGRALSQFEVTLQSNTITATAPVTIGPVFIDVNGNHSLDLGEQSFSTIKAAILASVDNDSIEVTAGTYTEVGQIVIDKNISIVGASSATVIIKTDSDTGNSGDTKGWFLVNTGKTFNISKVTLDGTGHKVYQALRYNGNGIVNDVKFTNIAFEQSGPQYNGAGVRMGATSNVNVTDSTFTNIGRVGVLNEGGISTISGNTYTGKGAGNWLDYGFEISYGANAIISGNTISGNLGVAVVDGSTSSGISVWDDAGTQATLSGNTITGNTAGVAIAIATGSTDPIVTINSNNTISDNVIGLDIQNAGADGLPSVAIGGSVFTNNTTGINIPLGMSADNITIHETNFSGNTTSINNLSTSTIDATNNWWGNETGPTNTTNPTGTGDVVSSNVNFGSWFSDVAMTTFGGTPTVVPTPAPTSSGGGGSGGGGMPVYTGVGNGYGLAVLSTNNPGVGQVLGASIEPSTQAQIASIKLQLRVLILELIIKLQEQITAMQA